jgi:hypothetical protein
MELRFIVFFLIYFLIFIVAYAELGIRLQILVPRTKSVELINILDNARKFTAFFKFNQSQRNRKL